MAIKLLAKRTDQDQAPVEYKFEEQDVITIGRDSSADLTLYDDDTMVSRLHARLELEGGNYHLSDLGSRNFTMLHGQQLTPGQQYPLNSGDTFNVANYEVQFVRTESVQPDFGETRFDAGFVNPFLTHADTLVHVLHAMETEYEKLPEVRMNAALAEALKHVLPKLQDSNVFARIVSEAGGSSVPPPMQAPTPQTPSQIPAAQPPPVSPPPFDPPDSHPIPPPAFERPATPVQGIPAPVPGAPPPQLNLGAANRSRIDKVLDVIIEFMSRQVKVPWQFKYEFIGHTFIPTEDTKGIYETDAAGLADFLFSAQSTNEEFERRLVLVQEALDEALAHQMALLEGYREAVSAGTKLMIDQMDPEKVQQSIQEDNVVFKYLSFLAQYKGWTVLAAKHFDLKQEDVSVLERRTYRPAFIKSYLESMSAIRKSD